MNYYKRIKDFREDSDLTQQDIADYLNITRGTYSMYECGSNIIPLKLLDLLSIKYQVSIDYLVGVTNVKERNSKKMNLSKMYIRLKEERRKLNYSQAQIAKLLNITQSHYITYEKGHNTIPITKLIILSKLYDVSIDYLVGKI